MRKFYPRSFKSLVLSFLFFGILTSSLQGQSFSQSDLDMGGNNINGGVTSLMYGPDGRLYVAEYPSGAIKIFTVQRNSATDYEVSAVQTLNGIQTMADHNDDGTLHNSTNRQVTGMTVAGTAANPIIYVASSDVRIGAGPNGGQGDIGLDTNSGVITRFTWNGGTWDVVDLVRGLPRSEENHATNGLEFTTINGTDYLIVASGGFTNAGAPSTNFVYSCEYALAAAVLSIDLDALNALPVLSDNGRSYIYDIPTLDDPTRPNVNGITDPDAPGYNGIDMNDPFGGNDGLNQAVVVPGGPVQIFSPGYRNTYDLVVTQSGALYVTDNGANGGWGGFPVNEGGGNATNAYDPNEPGSQSPPSGGEQIDNVDHLELVTTNLQTYVPGSFYGGHPNPIRANPNGAGLYTAPDPNGNANAVFRTQKYDPDGSTPGSTSNISIALPANWPPVQTANVVEGDWRGPTVPNPDGPDDAPIAIWGTNTNGIDEYTASNFGGAMQGDLLAGHSGGNIRRVQLNANGTLQNLNQTFMSGIGGNALGITCNGDGEVFPGTVWAGTFNGKIVVFEPQDFDNCIDPGEQGYDANADYDNDGYSNQDEEDNGTDPCNGGSQPDDFDAAAGAPLISDINDTDDDADGIPDASDPFQLGNPTSGGSDAFTIPINNALTNDQQGLGGIFGLGLTGLMNNGDTGANWVDWLDRKDDPNDPNPNDVLGGATGLMTSHMTSGTALGTTNSQEKGYQYGVQTSTATGAFTVSGNLINLVGPLRIYGNNAAVGGELGYFIGDGTQSNYIKIVLTTSGITALQEINDVPQSPLNVTIPVAGRPSSSVVFYFVVNAASGTVDLEYALDGGVRNTIGTLTAQGSILSAIQQANQDLAVGFIGTSGTPGVELEGTWDFLSVIQPLPDLTDSTWQDRNENENYTARHECSFVQAGDKFFLMGGRENAQTLDVYDYTSNTWASLTGSAPAAFNHFQATEYQGLIWVIGAFGDNGFPNEVPEEFIWAFDPATNDWIQGPEIPVSRRRGSAGLVVHNNKFYIVGGNTDGHDGGYVPWFDEYDPATGVWTPLGNAPRARDHFHAAVIGNQLYVAGGRLSGGAGGTFAPTIPEVDVYNFSSNSWSTLPAGQNIPTPRGGATTVNFDNKLVVIGGEVQNQEVYGTITTDALPITEQYDPATQTWSRLDDLINERHGTQAIKSGSGIFILGGSPNLGGGAQKNMEYIGANNPLGTPSASSAFSAPASVTIADGASENISLNVGNGNVGVFVTSMEITGPNAGAFTIINGELTNQLLSTNSSHTVTVGLGGSGANRQAILTINYGNGKSITVNLANFDNNLNVSNPGTQNNNEGDTVSLQIQANGASNFSATNLPPTLTIDSNTGLISGTISSVGTNTGPFEEANGLLVIQAESGELVPSWSQTTTGGATGIIAGSNHLGNQNGGNIPYQVTVTTPGVYRFNWRSFYSGSSPTDENDNWLRFPNNNNVWFFGFKGTPTDEASLIANVTSATPTDIVFPKGSSRVTPATAPEGSGSNGYFKIFRAGGAAGVYDWQAKTSDFDAHDIYVWFVNPGTYTMDISERSAGHAIDKVALYKLDGPNYTNGQLTAAPESQRTSGTGAADGSPYTVTVSVADNGNPPSITNTQFIWHIGEAGDPIANAEADPATGFIPLDVDFTGSNSTDDVGVTSYLWDFKDGSPLVTDANPTHTFTTVGTYEVELTVEDADGNTSTTTVTVTASDPASAGDVRINAGGPPLTFGGDNWSADTNFIGGSVFQRNIPIANTANDALYQTERFSGSGTLIYQIPVVAGVYNVNLHFAELFFGIAGNGAEGGPGSRVFNVNIENGQETLNNYDIIVAAGGSATAVIESFENITVNDGSLTITFTSVVEFPKISGIEVLVPGDTSAPNVFAGDDRTITVPNSTLTLDGTATDPDGGQITSFAWTQVSGPNTATFSNTTIEDPVVSDLVEGMYVFRLTATDDENDTAFDEVTITVAGEPESLFINAGGPALTFDGEDWIADNFFLGGNIFERVIPIENTENDALYQTERFGPGGSTVIYEIPVDFAGDYNVDLHFVELFFGLPGNGSAGGIGSRVFNVDIENGQEVLNNYDIFEVAGGGAIAIIESFKAVTVNDGNLTITLTAVTENPKISGIGVFETRPPEVDTGANQTITLPANSVVFNGTAADPDGGDLASFLWTQESGPTTATLVGETTTDLTVNNLVEGEYIFRLTVTDDEGETGFDEVTVTVVPENGANTPPVATATATPLTGTAPLQVAFTGSTSTDDIGVVSYAWDFGDNGATSTDADPEYTYATPGVYTATLTVTDAEGLTDTATVEIRVTDENGNIPLVARAEAEILSGLLVNFTGSGSTGGMGELTYSWNFGDGSEMATGADLEYLYQVSGTYEVTLTVTDENGNSATDTIQVVVTNAGIKVDLRFESNPPQPGSDVARIVIVNLPDGVTLRNVTVHDVGGKYVGGYMVPASAENTVLENFEIPVLGMQNGLYLVRVALSNGETRILKLLIGN